MGFEKFIEIVREVVEERLSKRVELKVVSKNNDVKLHAIAIFDEKSNLSPTIYLEQFWEMYERTGCLQNIIDSIVQMYTRGRTEKIDMEWFTCWDKVKDKIAYKLVNREANKELLETVPYTAYLDLAKVYYVIFDNEELGRGTITIHNNHLKMWGVKLEELEVLAAENTPKWFPMNIITFQEILENKGFGFESDEEYECCEINKDFAVLTNCDKSFGAAVMCYENVIKSIADGKESDIIIIPSSIHECLFSKLEDEKDLAILKMIVKDANEKCVLPEEKLSDSVYVYRRETDTIEIV